MSDGWIEWAGGECPVQPDTVVETEFRDGGREHPGSAFLWDWLEPADVSATLAERGSRYGPFDSHAEITQSLKRAMQATAGWQRLVDDQRESLEMVAHKIGRILNGDPNYDDSWHDIAGYAQLVADRLRKEQA